MADNETLDVNITGGVNGDSLEFDNLAAKKIEAKDVVSGHDHQLKARIEELEREKQELISEKDAMKAALEKLEEEKEAAGKKIEAAEAERDEMEMKAMESITKRAFELEGEVVRLQHDLGSAMNAGDEASREVERLMREIEELKREKSAMFEKLSAQISDLEKKIETLEESEREARRQAAIAEEKAKARLDELQSEIVQVKKEKSAVEDIMGSINAELRDSEKKVIEMGKRIEQLAENTQASGEILAGMVEKAAQRDAGFGGLKKVSLPVAGAVSAGVVVAALAVCCVNFSRTR